MKQGDIITVSLPGDYGKPRPAVIIQSDVYADLNSLTVLPLTSTILGLERTRVQVSPSPLNGLRIESQIMVEKISTLAKAKAGPPIGQLSPDDFAAVHRALAIFLGFV
jgi:mRNA interferase MazF